MGKKTKEHRKKIAKRNEQIKQQQKIMEKSQKDFLMQLIEMEKQKGLFDAPVMPMPGSDIPTLGIPNLGIPNGPQI
jgi:hypothetical protein